MAPTGLDFSSIEGHLEHAAEDLKNLATTGDITGHPEETARAEEQDFKNQEIQNQGEADYKNWLYRNSPDEFKQAYPAEYLYRKGYGAVEQAITEPAEKGLNADERAKVEGVAEAGLGTAGLPKPGEPEPVIKTGVILPEGAAEGGEEPVADFGSIKGHKVLEPEITSEGPAWDRTHKATIEGKPAGMIGYKADPTGKAQIYGSVVPEDMRGQGIGQKLYKAAVEDARAQGHHTITSDSTNVSPDAARVWQRMKAKGEPVEEITHPNGKPGYQIKLKENPESGKEQKDFPLGNKGYHEQAYKTSVPVKVTWPDHPDEEPHIDEVKGMNEGHALARARVNWPGAKVEKLERPEIKPTATVDPKVQQTVESAGGVYRGQNKDGIVEITLPDSMTKDLPISDSMKKFVSVNLPANEVTPEAVKSAMEKKRLDFGGKPSEQAAAPRSQPKRPSKAVTKTLENVQGESR